MKLKIVFIIALSLAAYLFFLGGLFFGMSDDVQAVKSMEMMLVER